MRAELAQVGGRIPRWRFALGCAWAAIVIRSRSRERGGGLLRAVVSTGIVTALALVLYGVVHYPGLRSGYRFWGSLAAFVGVLGIYAAATLLLSRGAGPSATLARRYGLTGGIAVGAAWFLALSPTHGLKTLVAIPLAIVLFGPASIGALAAHRTGEASDGTRAALWTAIVGGLLVFAIWVVVTYVDAGRPYDVGLVHDFKQSGANDLTTYAVGDDLGTGLVLLILVPMVALALGSIGAQFGRRSR
jgi:hypothetical protein